MGVPSFNQRRFNNKMNATVDDLVSTIGEQTVELRLLRQQVGALITENAALKVAQETNGKETKKDK